MERRNELRMVAREKANASISRPSAGVSADRGDLVLLRTTSSLRHRDRRGMKLQHDLYTGPWTVVEVLERGLSVRVEIQGLKQSNRRVSCADVKTFHVRPLSCATASVTNSQSTLGALILVYPTLWTR